MDKLDVLNYLDEISEEVVEVSLEIWNNPETSENEVKAFNLFKEVLKSYDFRITDIEDSGYAFVAEYGSGSPVIAVLGEYDALPGLSQKLDTKFNPVVENGPGHGCGHNLLGSAGLGSVLAIKKYLDETKKSGTIRFYGCPEEETLLGKVKMAKVGAFDDCDIALSWHPMNANVAIDEAFLSNNSIKFKFNGISAHAAQSPESGRSALDAVELMNVGANYLREHVIDSARIHYTITNAGGAPNIVPKEAESWYFVRAPYRKDVEEITERLIKVAKGAAMMTETTVEHTILGGCYEKLPNNVLFDLTYKNMMEIPTPEYTEEELEFAKTIQESLDPDKVDAEIKKYGLLSDEKQYIHQGVVDKDKVGSVVVSGSSDSGDVSWLVPMNLFLTATWPLGVPAHSWQATASSGSSMGNKGMIYAAKIFSGMMYDLLNDPKLVEEAKEEFEKRTKKSKYKSPLA
ncbi:MAG: amidohydrolase [Tissierellia bacterium]|nr:amidohydrolase [Tissierellia bacterium]